MREIEFRGYRADGNGWVYGDLIQDYPHHTTGLSIQQHGVIIHEVDKESVGQYTGVTDIIGVKIFEGDLVKSEWGFSGEVIFDEGAFSVMTDHGYKQLLFNNVLEVIGNKYNNDN